MVPLLERLYTVHIDLLHNQALPIAQLLAKIVLALAGVVLLDVWLSLCLKLETFYLADLQEPD